VITLPTCELTGILNDTIPFALDDPEYPEWNCIRICWDGDQLHTQARDEAHAAWSRWHPDDDPDQGSAQESLLEPYGGDDQPWTVVIRLADAKALTKMHKVDKKQMFAPVAIGEDAGNLRVHRNRQPGLMAITTTIEGQEVKFPDLAAVVTQHDRADAVRTIAFTPGLIAHFGQVRPRGPMEVTFTGQRGPAIVAIGDRFTGLIQPVRAAVEQGLKAVA